MEREVASIGINRRTDAEKKNGLESVRSALKTVQVGHGSRPPLGDNHLTLNKIEPSVSVVEQSLQVPFILNTQGTRNGLLPRPRAHRACQCIRARPLWPAGKGSSVLASPTARVSQEAKAAGIASGLS